MCVRVYIGPESTERRYPGYRDCVGRVNQEGGKERIPGTGGRGVITPSVNRLEVGPRYELVATGARCVELDGNTQAVDSHRSLGTKAFDGLQETPSGHGTQLDFIIFQHTRSADNTPPVIETLGDCQSLSH